MLGGKCGGERRGRRLDRRQDAELALERRQQAGRRIHARGGLLAGAQQGPFGLGRVDPAHAHRVMRARHPSCAMAPGERAISPSAHRPAPFEAQEDRMAAFERGHST
jgi:hypothetical protein